MENVEVLRRRSQSSVGAMGTAADGPSGIPRGLEALSLPGVDMAAQVQDVVVQPTGVEQG